MEAWKFINYTSLSPVFALSLTTQRWGLEPFPGNVIAIANYLHDDTGSDISQRPAWKLPYTCSDSTSSLSLYENVAFNDGNNSNNNNTTISSNNSTICSRPQPCSDSGCLILIEGIGKTKAGPASSDILGLSYGITSVLVVIFNIVFITIANKMGNCFSTSQKSIGTISDPENPALSDYLQKGYNPPPQQQQIYAEQTPRVPINMSGEVVRCSELLRAMYTLDLVIWGKGDCVIEEIPEREDMKKRANALFSEIQRILYSWRTASDCRWTVDERAHIEEIGRMVDQYESKRYIV